MTTTTDMKALKTSLKAMWMAGDYGRFAKYMEPGAMEFFERLSIAPGERVLDVACGAGQIALLAARAGAIVTGIDIATNLIEQARARAQAAGLKIHFAESDAENLLCDDAEFDVVVSLIGAMFAPQPERAASELLRVCRPGGRIVMGNWTPRGFVGQMFKIYGRYAPPPPDVASPLLWGDEAVVRERLRDGLADLRLTRRMYPIRYPFPPSAVVEFFRTHYGPASRAFALTEPTRHTAFRHELERLWSAHNQSSNGGAWIEAEYLEVAAIRA